VVHLFIEPGIAILQNNFTCTAKNVVTYLISFHLNQYHCIITNTLNFKVQKL